MSIISRLVRLREMLDGAWAADTASPGTQWRDYLPSEGHCAVVALIIYQKFGGELLSTRVDGSSHWYNRIRDESGAWMEVDLTADQFDGPSFQFSRTPPCQPLYAQYRVRPLSDANDETIVRSDLLLSRVLARGEI